MTTPQMETVSAALLVLFVVFRVLAKQKKRSSRYKGNTQKRRTPTGKRTEQIERRRPDHEILTTPLAKLSWMEFERLLAIYFRDHGYVVEETGVGGNDGGVDLVLVDKKTNERTAIQIKWRSQSSIGPDVVRELHSARWNTEPRCLYGMLITNSEITQQARKEAEARRITFWHGGLLEHKLSSWSRYAPEKTRRRSNVEASRVAVSRVAGAVSKSGTSDIKLATSRSKGNAVGQMKCVCGAEMVERKGRHGAFWGCSRYPICKHTRPV